MNLGELLQELRCNVLHDRSDQVAGGSDYLWSDETLVRYIDEAHRRFARRSWIIRDNTSSITNTSIARNLSLKAIEFCAFSAVTNPYMNFSAVR